MNKDIIPWRKFIRDLYSQYKKTDISVEFYRIMLWRLNNLNR